MTRRLCGQVVRHTTAKGSKSERQAMFLRMADGTELILRRLGAHAFHDAVLAKLEGKRIECSGELRGRTILITEWREVGQ